MLKITFLLWKDNISEMKAFQPIKEQLSREENMPTTSYSRADNGNDKCELRYFRTRWKGAKFDKYGDSLLKVSVSQPLLVISRLLWKKNQMIWSSWQSALPTTLACSACLGCSVLEEYGHCNWGKSTDSVLIVDQKIFSELLINQ